MGVDHVERVGVVLQRVDVAHEELDVRHVGLPGDGAGLADDGIGPIDADHISCRRHSREIERDGARPTADVENSGLLLDPRKQVPSRVLGGPPPMGSENRLHVTMRVHIVGRTHVPDRPISAVRPRPPMTPWTR